MKTYFIKYIVLVCSLFHIYVITSQSCCRFDDVNLSFHHIPKTGLKSGDSGGHLSSVSSFSCSRNQFVDVQLDGSMFLCCLHEF